MLNLGLLFMSLYSLQVLSAPPIHAKLQWNCQQDQYPEVLQITNAAEIKIWFTAAQGRTKGNIEPNIFNPKAQRNTKYRSITVDYVKCLLNFSDTIIDSIKVAQATHCPRADTNPLCAGEASQLKSFIDTLTWGSLFITKRATWPKLPPTLPGSSLTEVDNKLIKTAVETFCETGRHEPMFIFAGKSSQYVADNSSASCKRRFATALVSYAQTLKDKVCNLSKPLCNHIQKMASQTVNFVSPGFTGVALTEEEKQWMARLLPISQEELFLSDKEVLEKDLSSSSNPDWCPQKLNPFITKTLGHMPDLSNEALIKSASNLNEDCFKALIRSLTFYWPILPKASLTEIPEFKNFCSQNPRSSVCAVPGERKKSQSSLLKILAHELGDKDKDEIYSMLQSEMDKTYADSTDRWKAIQSKLSCREILPGEKRLIGSFDSIPTNVGARYQLHLRQDGIYEVNLGMHFTGAEDGVTSEKMFSRVKTCIKGVSDYLKSPDGKPLGVNILTKAEAEAFPLRQRPPIVNLTIQKLVKNGRKKSRSHSTSYESNIDCSAITHEVLHLLGLYDEYEETDICFIKKGKSNKAVPWGTPGAKCYSPTGSNYNCRAVAAVNSIMSEHWDAFDTVIPNSISCECNPRRANQPSWEGYCHKVMSGPDGMLKNLYLMATLSEVLPVPFKQKYCGDMKHDKSVRGAFRGEKSLSIDEQRSSTTKLTILTQELEYSVQTGFHNEITCECPEDEPACVKEMEKVREKILNVAAIKTKNCPTGTGGKTKYLNAIENPDIVARVNAAAQGYIHEKNTLYLANQTTATNLLHPSHYKRITGGACTDKVKDYNICSEWTYKQNLSCAGRLAVCEDGIKFLGIDKVTSP